MKLAIFAYSRRGRDTALRARDCLACPEDEVRCFAPEQYAGGDFVPLQSPCARFTGPLFAWADTLVFVGAAGIAVRSIAPYIADKRTDPAVLCVDELGQFVIPLLSGHIGGANALALRLARGLGAVPVVTTATDVNGKFSVDAWAARQGLFISDMKAAKAVSAAILERTVPLCCRFPVEGPLPPGTERGDRGAVGVCISCRDEAPFQQTLLLVPPVLHLGLGCRRGTPEKAIRAAVEQALSQHGIHLRAVKCAASIDLKRDEPGLLSFCAAQNLPLSFYSAAELRALEGDFTPSERVLRITGVDNVCERAAMMGARRLIVRKTVCSGVTIAVAEEDWTARFPGSPAGTGMEKNGESHRTS